MRRVVMMVLLLMLSIPLAAQPAQLPRPDSRFKSDIVLVVAHPDDETAIGGMLAKAVFDEKKSVAIVYCTRGTGGGNNRGVEQAAAMGLIREIEGRKAAAAFGIQNVWFVGGRDTPGQDVLKSLQEWGHGQVLEEVVRIIRLTRPEVILTWLPHVVAGENHGDHQASGVIATEAFDCAGDPTVFPAQVVPPREPTDISNATEGLTAWQPKKIYYFSDASREIVAEGPAFDWQAISPTKKVSYVQLTTLLQLPHETQGGESMPAKKAVATGRYDEIAAGLARFKLIFGKSVVPASPRGDLFEGVTEGTVPFAPPPGYRPEKRTGLAITLGGPYEFYRQFWKAHAIERIGPLAQPEIEIGVGSYLHVPLLIRNDTGDTVLVDLRGDLPAGWVETTGSGKYRLRPGDQFPAQVFVRCPDSPTEAALLWKASVGTAPVGSVTMRVKIVEWNLPQ